MMQDCLDVTLATEHMPTYIAALLGAGMKFDQSLMHDSISYYNVIVFFSDDNKNGRSLVISNELNKFCWWNEF
jgi:hypothetical protein